MPWSALPEHLNTPEKVAAAFPDDSQFGTNWFGRLYQWFQKQSKPWTAFGPRATEWWARWRELPVVIFAIFGPGESRWEESSALFAIRSVRTPVIFHWPQFLYLSRIQLWCDWHIQVQWPLFFAFHVYYGKNKLIYSYIGAKRDGDRVYWFPAVYIGFVWK